MPRRMTDIVRRDFEAVRSQIMAEDLAKRVRKAPLYAVGAFLIVLGIYFTCFVVVPAVQWSNQFGWSWTGLQAFLAPGEQSVWGQFGDYMGGILNPIIAGFALYWLTRSVEIQQTELSETREALLDSADSQREQVESLKQQLKQQQKSIEQQKKLAQINGLNVIITSINADINYMRENVAFLTDQVRHLPQHGGRFVDIYGNAINQDRTMELIESMSRDLLEKSNGRDETMSELHKLLNS